MRNPLERPGRFIGAVNTGRLSLQAGVAGLMGVAAMLLLMQFLPVFGLPLVQLPYMLGHEMSGYALSEGGGLIMAWITVLATGVGLALVYAWLVERRRPASGVGAGALFALVPWLLVGVVLFPAMDLGVFAGASDASALGVALSTLLGFLAFGAVMGGLLKRLVRDSAQPVARLLRESRV